MNRPDPRLFIALVMVLAVLGTAFFTRPAAEPTVFYDLTKKVQQEAKSANDLRPAAGSDIEGDMLWTATRNLTASENASRHFRKYSKMFRVKTVEEYVARATAFLNTPPPGTQKRTQKDGDTVMYNAQTGEFGVMTPEGIPRTYYKPNPDRHGYPTNQAYFEAQ